MRAVLSPEVLMGGFGACDSQVDDVLGLGSLLGVSRQLSTQDAAWLPQSFIGVNYFFTLLGEFVSVSNVCVIRCLFISLGPRRGSLVTGRVDVGGPSPPTPSLVLRCCCRRHHLRRASLTCFQCSLPRLIFNWKLSQQWNPRAPDGTASPHFNVNLTDE